MMSKFYVGQKVTPIKDKPQCAMVFKGEVCIVTSILGDLSATEGNYEINGKWHIFGSLLDPITETPETLTINGVEYIRKPEPTVEHEWKFGDVATHEKYGVGIVTRVDGKELEFYYKNGDYSTFVKPQSLTFIRRADLSV